MERLVGIIRHSRGSGQGGFLALFLTLIILGLATVAEAAPSVSASLDSGRFAVDQTATLTITINDGGGTISELPEVDGLLFQRRGQNSQYQIINGSLSSSVTTVYQVQATRTGTFTIPPIAISVDGRQMLTEAISLEVTPAADSSSQPSGSDSQSTMDTKQLAFLRISPVKEQSYAGELLPVEIKAYFRQGIRASLNSHPRLNGDGFVLNLPTQEPEQGQEMVNNVPYSVLTWSGALSGIKEGSHGLNIGIEATLLLPSAQSQRRRPMGSDPFFGNDRFADFFNQQQLQEKKLRIVSKEMSLQVLSLPVEERPADFNGAIGTFELQVEAQPTDVGPGDPITLTMTVEGRGNFDQVEAPVLSESEGWKRYPPSGKFRPGASPGEGSKVFEQAIIARSRDKSAIPPLLFSFFDPESGKYQTLRSDPIALQGHGGGLAGNNDSLSGKASGNSDEQRQPDASELRLAPLHAQMGALRQGLTPIYTRISFQLLVLFSLLLLVGLTLIRIRAGRLDRNPALCRRQEMTRLLELRLQEMKQFQGRGETWNFLAACRKAMQEQLGLLWQTEPGAITLSDLRQRLASDSPLTALFATAESSAYSGKSLGSPEMADYAGKVERELRQLQ